jgi:TonB family protein
MKMNYKLKIMKTKPEISDEEIRGYMHFDALIKKQASLISARNKSALIQKIAITSITTLVLAVVWYIYQSEKNTSQLPVTSDEKVITQTEDIVVLTDSSQFAEQSNQISVVEPPSAENELPIKPITKSVDQSAKITQENSAQITLPNEDVTKSHEYEFKEAVPIDGYPAIYEYFSRTLQYPEEGLKDSIQGVVTVSFIINESGTPEKIQIENSLGEAFDRETIKMIEHMPRWNPATVNGNPIASRLAIPLTFQIKKFK